MTIQYVIRNSKSGRPLFLNINGNATELLEMAHKFGSKEAAERVIKYLLDASKWEVSTLISYQDGNPDEPQIKNARPCVISK